MGSLAITNLPHWERKDSRGQRDYENRLDLPQEVVMSQAVSVAASERLVSDADHLQLSRLVTEHSFTADSGRSDTRSLIIR